MKIANPQGKGNHLLTNNWYPKPMIKRKELSQVVREFFYSSLVLACRFDFKPVVDQIYSIYLWNTELRLSLIEPERINRSGVELVGYCNLKADLTWSVNLISSGNRTENVQSFLEHFLQGFEEHLQESDNDNDVLPFYREELNYYPRLFASGLASSLSQSIDSDLTSKRHLSDFCQKNLLTHIIED